MQEKIKVCSINDCERIHYARKMCALHWKQARKAGEFGHKDCLQDGCKKHGVSRGYCDAHYDINRHLGLFGGKICEQDRCERTQVSRGYCRNHYQIIRMSGGWGGNECSIKNCNNIAIGLGYCRRHYWLHKQYGIDPYLYDELEIKQNKLCAICNKITIGVGRLHLDHDHKTGKVRGLLCSNCNTSLGGFMDDVELLKKAIEYIGGE